MGCGIQMGKGIIHFKVRISLLIIILSNLILCFYFFNMINSERNNPSNSKGRILLNNEIYKAQNGDYSGLSKYIFTNYDLEGRVIKSNNEETKEGTKVDIKTISSLDVHRDYKTTTYTSPYILNGTQKGTIVVSIANSNLIDINIISYIPILLLILLIFVACNYLYKTITVDILNPINDIHKVTNNIINGDLSTPLKYDYDGEIGTLCHDFESLREDLSYSLNNEKTLKEKEKLLFAYISHDLRTPISTISGYVEGIQSGIVKDEDGIKEYTDIILKKIHMLNGLIEDILEHSKAQLNELSLSLKECYAYSFFEEILLEGEKDVKAKNRNFTYSNAPNVLICIDKKRIEQVMQNIIGNAMKFTEENGNINVDFRIYESNLLVSVQDDGIGISASDLPMIFHEFYRGEKARTLNVPGSGLGLNITKYIVEKHGGQIECDSILNIGTTITFSLTI